MKRTFILKTAEEFYKEIASSAELQAELKAASDEMLGAFLKKHGCDADVKDFTAFVRSQNEGEVDDDDAGRSQAVHQCMDLDIEDNKQHQRAERTVTMKLKGELKEKIEKTENKEQAKEILDKTGIELTDEELEQMSGGIMTKPIMGGPETIISGCLRCGYEGNHILKDCHCICPVCGYDSGVFIVV